MQENLEKYDDKKIGWEIRDPSFSCLIILRWKTEDPIS